MGRTSEGESFGLPPEGLIMPAPDQHGQATERPLESGECGKWLRKLLDVAHPAGVPGVRRVSSHSLKCTMLSFAAKRGLPVPDRLMLGYHSSNMQMSLVYSRDGAAASLLLLERLIDEIVKGKFRPDSTRSGRIVESPVELPGPQLGKVKVEVVDSSDDEAAVDAGVEESSDSISDSSSSDQCIPQDHSLNKVYAPPEPPSGFSRWQHSKLKTLHLTAEGYVNVFVCGRKVEVFTIGWLQFPVLILLCVGLVLTKPNKLKRRVECRCHDMHRHEVVLFGTDLFFHLCRPQFWNFVCNARHFKKQSSSAVL